MITICFKCDKLLTDYEKELEVKFSLFAWFVCVCLLNDDVSSFKRVLGISHLALALQDMLSQ